MPWTLKFLFLPAALLLSSGCTTAGTTSTNIIAPLDGGERRIMNRDIVGRFPGATVLDEVEFARTIIGRRFRYRLSSEIVVVHPAEAFSEGERYSVGHRVFSHGTYSFERGIVSIECIDCRETFLGLGRQRVFFRHQGTLLMANADGEGNVIELIPEL